MNLLTLVIALALASIGTALYFLLAKPKGMSGRSADSTVRRGHLETGQHVAVMKLTPFGDVTDQVVGYGRILAFSYAGRAVIRTDRDSIVRRKDCRLRPTAN